MKFELTILTIAEINFDRLSKNADFRENADREDHHPGGRAKRHHRKCKGQNSGKKIQNLPNFNIRTTCYCCSTLHGSGGGRGN